MSKRENTSSDYWRDRQAAAQANLTKKTLVETERQLSRYYERASKSVIAEFENTYYDLLYAVGSGRAPTPADLYKLDTYWRMLGQTRIELERLGNRQALLMSKNFMDEYIHIYEGLALKTNLNYGSLSKETAEQMINLIWCADGKSWSSRIWTNINELQETLNDGLIECVLTGKKPTELKHILQQRFNVSYSKADSIVRTELAHIQTEAARKRYEDAGVSKVMVWADEDERRCDVCGKLHKKIYYANEQIPIPAHPRCRCCIIPVIE